MAVMCLDPTSTGRKHWTMRWEPALNAFEIAFDGRLAAVVAGARVIAAAGAPERQAFARDLGADVTLATGPGLVDALRDATDGRGVDLVVDAAGGDMVAQGVQCLRAGGQYVLYGAHGGERVELDLINLFRSYTSLVASRGWLLEDMRQVITATARGRITVPVQERDLSQAAAAHRDLGERRAS